MQPDEQRRAHPFVQTAVTVVAMGCVLALVALALMDRFGGVR